MFKDKDSLKIHLLKYSETERLERHVDVEIAYASEKDNTKKLEEALKAKERECAELRHDIKKYDKIFNSEMRDAINDTSMDIIDRKIAEEIKDSHE